MTRLASAFAALLLCAGTLSNACAKEELLDFSGRADTGFKAIHTFEPNTKPAFVALLLPGGKGDFRFQSADGGIAMINAGRLPNPLRALLLQRGAASYLVDAPSDMSELIDDFRSGPKHLDDLKAVLADAAKRYPGIPVVAIGHSNGSISAAHLGASAPQQVNGVVLINGRLNWVNYTDQFFNGAGLTGFNWDKITMPLALVHHKKDDCFATQYSGAAKLADNVTRFELVTVDPEGSSATGKCGYESTHNMSGQEATVADSIVNWVKKAVIK